MKLTGNTILITGGGSGIGQALAWRFHDLGNTVIVAGRGEARLQETIAGRERMLALQLDVADNASVDAAIEKLKRDFPELNAAILSAGVMTRQELGTGGTIATAEEVININLLGTIRVAEALIPLLAGKPNAAICTVTSGLAFTPLPGAPAYSASKAAIHSYSLSLRQRLKGQVQVIEIAPPGVQTGLTPGQETRQGYMPLDAYIDETMGNFEREPDGYENLVGNVLPLRWSERDGTTDAILERLASV
ncbi:MAG: SDR family NAD(P)-dependent oxidoreductase [Candidatus Andeanibacterium colombiense]|uniref:SDR family NAD(P)-dependent oxidoreductase n=1 Tax=Candidatus Andeanibacterium colombiense TaxID=3121345 RepID=A0AAJ5X8R6_9SPHN|nr:MAG: SDR family NAD(P)-dependent oxidoreductase [Sphingomonadaceae bacterium]